MRVRVRAGVSNCEKWLPVPREQGKDSMGEGRSPCLHRIIKVCQGADTHKTHKHSQRRLGPTNTEVEDTNIQANHANNEVGTQRSLGPANTEVEQGAEGTGREMRERRSWVVGHWGSGARGNV